MAITYEWNAMTKNSPFVSLAQDDFPVIRTPAANGPVEGLTRGAVAFCWVDVDDVQSHGG